VKRLHGKQLSCTTTADFVFTSIVTGLKITAGDVRSQLLAVLL
jgi:hypothetical protein